MNKLEIGQIFSFRKKLSVDHIIIQINENEVLVRNLEQGTAKKYSIKEIIKSINKGKIIFSNENKIPHSIDQLGKEQIEILEYRYKFVRAALNEGVSKSKPKLEELSRKVSKNIMELSPPSYSTLIRWIDSYIEFGYLGLINKSKLKRKYTSRLNPKIMAIIKKVTDKYVDEYNRPISVIYKKIECSVLELAREEKLNYQIPSYNTIKNYIDRLPYYEKVVRTKGKAYARNHITNTETTPPKVTRILEKIEIDHTQLDMDIYDEVGIVKLGRPYLTTIIDCYSSMILGYTISYEQNSVLKVFLTLRMAFLKKEDPYQWPCHGIPESIVIDNGKEFIGNALQSVSNDLGFVVQVSPVKAPKYKPKVERTYGTINTEFLYHFDNISTPGTKENSFKGHNNIKSSEYGLSLNKLIEIFEFWLLNIYHKTPRANNIESPLELWEESEKENLIPVVDSKKLSIVLLPSSERVLSKMGIRFEHLNYSNIYLKELFKIKGKINLTFKYNPLNLLFILVFDEENNCYMQVNCVEYEYSNGISMFEHRSILKERRSIVKEKLNDKEMIESKIKFNKKVEESVDFTRQRKTQKTKLKSARAMKEGFDVDILKDIGDVANVQKEVVQNKYFDDDLNMEGWGDE
ncbi:DDE-type integrase/transposase/recombinase [Marinicellulosiphila megalodicopiae]|uniref:DDE-type integrase/transposase/recombinase n=1 Tax=Marinicellulosiphila megalodicopiae TaxID=2724896 RepID=UPI003BB1FFAD